MSTADVVYNIASWFCIGWTASDIGERLGRAAASWRIRRDQRRSTQRVIEVLDRLARRRLP